MRFYLLIIVAVAYLAYVSSDSCVQCNSNKDPNCATNPLNFLYKDCGANVTTCYSRVLNGNTIRGCISELDNATINNCRNEMECLTCNTFSGCNRDIFPRHRPSCLICEGNATSDCALNYHAPPSICPIYKLGDSCYVRNTGKNTSNSFQRGCLSSALAKNLCKDNRNCFICEGPGCNYLQANSSQIPIARDSAHLAGYSISLLAAGLLAARFF